MSHICPTTNVLLKITVPKRTGRKRKRGSQDPYLGDINAPPSSAPMAGNLRSHSRLDRPVDVVRALKDNVGKYEIEAVAEIERTHRFRGIYLCLLS
jgi:general transcription factor 3C polypeptide 5 (transcription factor C subunit 1)